MHELVLRLIASAAVLATSVAVFCFSTRTHRSIERHRAGRGYSAACRTWASRPARTSRPGSAPVCSPCSKIGVPATSVAS